MPCFLNELGLDFMVSNKEDSENLIAYIVENGHIIKGYFGLPYINYQFGRAQMINRCGKVREDTNSFEMTGFDTHCEGFCVWKVKIENELADESNSDKLFKKIIIKTIDGDSPIVTYVVNADVLPSYAPEEEIKLQMIAFAVDINYYATEKENEAIIPEGLNGIKLILEENRIFPTGLFNSSGNPAEKSYSHIRGKVKKLLKGKVSLGEAEISPYIDCVVETQFGDIEILHTVGQVKEEQRKNLDAGSFVDCVVILSGDAAIYEYEKGIVKNQENNLKLIKYSFSNGDPERLRTALSNDIEYYSDASKKSIHNADELIDFVNFVHAKSPGRKLFYAEITDIKEGEEKLEFGIGTKCLVISYGADKGYDSILFLQTNDNGLISRIYISNNSRYRFNVDLPEPEDFPLKSHDSYQDAMVTRAHYFRLFSHSITTEDVEACLKEHQSEFDNKIYRVPEYESPKDGMGEAFLCGVQSGTNTGYNEEEILEIGQKFYLDFCHYIPCEKQKDELYNALMFVQSLGYLYRGRCNTWKDPFTN